MPPREVEVAAPVVKWLKDLEWTVYQEVEVPSVGIADIVATRGPLVWVVEAKAAYTLKVLDQAARWLPCAHHVSIAVHREKAKRPGEFTERFLRDLGIGVFVVHGGTTKWDSGHGEANEDFYYPRPALHRNVDSKTIRERLNPEHASFCAAGTACGGYWTPFKATCEALRDHMRANPGCSLKSAIDGIKHHYRTPSSARGSLSHWIHAGKVPGVAFVGRKLVLTETQEAR